MTLGTGFSVTAPLVGLGTTAVSQVGLSAHLWPRTCCIVIYDARVTFVNVYIWDLSYNLLKCCLPWEVSWYVDCGSATEVSSSAFNIFFHHKSLKHGLNCVEH